MIRAVDTLVAGVALIVLSPLLALCSLAVLIFSGKPIFYRAKRVGQHGRPIEVLKFRSMSNDNAGSSVTVGGDDRITKVGQILRATKFDELPQLLNVVRGEMSLVGPRPEDPRFVEMFKDEFATVLSVPPGITGAASLKYHNEAELLAGFESPEDHYIEVLLPDKLRIESEYVQDRSVLGNVRLILATLRALRPAR